MKMTLRHPEKSQSNNIAWRAACRGRWSSGGSREGSLFLILLTPFQAVSYTSVLSVAAFFS